MEGERPLRLVFFGSGAFGLPTLRRLASEQEVALIVSQPDRPAGRRRSLTPTPIAEFASDAGFATFKPENPNAPDAIERIHSATADAFVVIAYGHRLGKPLLGDYFAINLHASLLPKFRGAAPVQWSMIRNESVTGVSVITLAQRMDAGEILGRSRTAIDPLETAGELESRLAELGPDLVAQVLDEFRAGALHAVPQDESQATAAPKLTKADGTLPCGFAQSAAEVRARIHGLTPWPGCTVRFGDQTLKLIRVQEMTDAEFDRDQQPGTLRDDGVVRCAEGAVRILELQPPGGRVMQFKEYARGHALPQTARWVPL